MAGFSFERPGRLPPGCDTRRPSLDHAATSSRLTRAMVPRSLWGLSFFSFEAKSEDQRPAEPRGDQPRFRPTAALPVGRQGSLPRTRPTRALDQSPTKRTERRPATPLRPPADDSHETDRTGFAAPFHSALPVRPSDRTSSVAGSVLASLPLVSEFPTRIAFSSGDSLPSHFALDQKRRTNYARGREFPEREYSQPSDGSPQGINRDGTKPHSATCRSFAAFAFSIALPVNHLRLNQPLRKLLTVV